MSPTASSKFRSIDVALQLKNSRVRSPKRGPRQALLSTNLASCRLKQAPLRPAARWAKSIVDASWRDFRRLIGHVEGSSRSELHAGVDCWALVDSIGLFREIRRATLTLDGRPQERETARRVVASSRAP